MESRRRKAKKRNEGEGEGHPPEKESDKRWRRSKQINNTVFASESNEINEIDRIEYMKMYGIGISKTNLVHMESLASCHDR